MDRRFQTKSDLYVFAGYMLLGLALAVNMFTVPWWQDVGLFPEVHSWYLHQTDVMIMLPCLLDVFCVVIGLIIILAPKPIKVYLNDSIGFNAFIFVMLFLTLLTTNGIHPGKFRILRILLVLVILFFLTNVLYRLVVKPAHGKHIHSFIEIWR